MSGGQSLGVDFGKLRKDFVKAKARDERYSRENDAKFRAVSQRVATYEEFKEIVDASHLQPLDKGDKIQSRPKHTWNVAASQTGATSNVPASNPTQAVSSSTASKEGVAGAYADFPKTMHEFNKLWRRSPSADRYVLLVTRTDAVLHVMGAELSSDFLVDVITVLNEELRDVTHANAALHLLHGLSTRQRFSLNLDFFTSEEKQKITSLLSKLFDITLQQSASSPEVGESLIGAEHVTPEAAAASENVKSVAQLYGVLLSTS